MRTVDESSKKHDQTIIIYFITYFSSVVLFNVVFSFKPAQARRQKKLQHPTRPVENVELTTKGLQERKHSIEWDDGGKIGNKNK